MGQYGPQRHLALGAIVCTPPLPHPHRLGIRPTQAQHLTLDDSPLLSEPLKWA